MLKQEREQISGKWSVAWPGMWHLRDRKQFICIWGTLAWSCPGLMPAQIRQLAGREDVYFDDDHVNREHWQSRGKDKQSQVWTRRSQFGGAASQALSMHVLQGLQELHCCQTIVIPLLKHCSFAMHFTHSRRGQAEVVPSGHGQGSWSCSNNPFLEPQLRKAGWSTETALSPHPNCQGWAVTTWICSWVN